MAVVELGALAAMVLGIWLAYSSWQHRPGTHQLTKHQVTEQQLTVDQLRTGDCLTGSDLSPGVGGIWPYTASEWPYKVTAVGCNQPHLAEVFYTGNLWPASLATYPGDDAVSSMGEGQCALVLNAYAGDSTAVLTLEFVTPGGGDWALGDREVVCIAYEPGVWLRRSVKATGR